MWLINVTTKALEKFADDYKKPPPYAILSHTWGADHEEISFQELQDGKIKKGLGQYKFDECCSQASRDGLSYAWIDTCCIDKTNSTELGEAINSMFKWYKHAEICYAYLYDVNSGEDLENSGSSFRKSRWFQRGWALQELIAPATVRFYGRKWNVLGTKHNLAQTLFQITRIPEPYLLGNFPFHEASVAQRMSWAAGRVTKREEDLAYCLLEIFGITMPMIYGEGAGAFIRLQRKIASHIGDDSILAWNFGDGNSTSRPSKARPVGALAPNPTSFTNSSHIIHADSGGNDFGSLHKDGAILSVRRRLHTNSSSQCFVILQCQPEDQQGRFVGIPVQASTGGSHNYLRLAGQTTILLPENVPQTDPEDIRILLRHSEEYNTSTRHNIHIENNIQNDLKLIEVIPHSNWQQGQTVFFIDDDARQGRITRIWTMFQYQ
ncbi:heterokaryon incompatibility protein-domain-containing protein [Xylaria digitata]|nr:heterokaryon incompatibility protein-domain-containing protein [Xylaria digitata]